MATRLNSRASGNIKQMLATWAALANTDVGDALSVEGAAAILVSILSGVLGAGGTITWQGSNDGTTWFTLTSAIGAPAAVTQNALNANTMIQEQCRFIRPNVTAGDGTTALVAIANITFA